MIQNNKKENLIIKLKHIILMQEALKVLPPVVCYEKMFMMIELYFMQLFINLVIKGKIFH